MQQDATRGIRVLRDALTALPDGTVSDARSIEVLLSSCWNDFRGADTGGMHAGKLLGRTSDMTWVPPMLRFRLERHGGTVLGSSRATIQEWTLDVEAGIAAYTEPGYRQLHPMQARLDIQPLAAELADVIVRGIADPRVWRSPDGSVRLLIGQVIPEGSAAARTVAGRRRRLRGALNAKLQECGYEIARTNKWQPVSSLRPAV